MEKLMNILSTVRPDVDFLEENRLIDDAVLDSFDIISIVSEINDVFDIHINITDLVPENFNSAKGMWSLIEKAQSKG